MRFLIIDDEINITTSLKSILEDEGYECEAATSSNEGLKILDSFLPDIVFLDVKIPDIDGLETLSRIISYDSSILVIMISGHSGISEAVQAMKKGAFDFLEKPLSLMVVKSTAKKAIEYRQLTQDYLRLKTNNCEKYKIIGESNIIKEIHKTIAKVARTDTKVLIRGESGTGKELIAYGIHNQSSRQNKPFIKFNSAAIPGELVESELFGFEKGAFTGAVKSKKGKIEEADNGTLFLDEIGDMSMSAQAKILRVIQEGEFERVGSNKTHRIDVRIIAATHRNLEEMIEKKEFREDLYYRLNVVPLISPPLRERVDDIPLLIKYFSLVFSRELKISEKIFPEAVINEFKRYPFPGNVRELKNLIERVYILSDNQLITINELNLRGKSKENNISSYWEETKSYIDKKKEFEINFLSAQLNKYENNVTKTATAIELHQSNLSRKLKELGIS